MRNGRILAEDSPNNLLRIYEENVSTRTLRLHLKLDFAFLEFGKCFFKTLH